jgi:hypothetical protein
MEPGPPELLNQESNPSHVFIKEVHCDFAGSGVVDKEDFGPSGGIHNECCGREGAGSRRDIS